MIAGIVPFLPLVVLACCVSIVIFGLLVRKRPVIAGLGIAAVVLCTICAALSVKQPGHLTAVWPGHVRLHLPAPPVPSVAPEIHVLEQGIADIRQEEAKMAAQGRRHAAQAARERRISNSELAKKGHDTSIHYSEFAIVNSSPVAGVPGALSLRLSVEVVELDPVDIRTTPESLNKSLRRNSVRHGPLSMAWLLPSLLTALSIGAFLAVGYVFLDAGTRGQFTWPLRIASVVAFAAICVAVAALRNQL